MVGVTLRGAGISSGRGFSLGALCYRSKDKFHPDVPWDQALQ